MKKSIIVLIGNLMYALAYWLILLYFIKFESIEIVGLYGLVLSVTTPLIIFLNFQIRSLQAVDINFDYEYFEYKKFREITFSVGVFLIVILSFILNVPSILFFSIALMKLLDSLSEVNYGFFQQRRIIKYIPVFKIIKSLIIMGMLFWGYIVDINDVSQIFLIISIFLLGIYLLEIFLIKKMGVSIRGDLKRDRLKKIAIYGFPLMIATFLGSLNSNIPRYVLASIEDISTVGYYTAFVYLISVGNLFVSSIAQVYVTPLTSIWQSKDIFKIKKTLNFVLIRISTIFILFAIVVYLLSDYLILILFDESYLLFKTEFNLTILAALISYIGAIFGYFNVATKDFKVLVKLSLIWVGVTLMSSIVCILLWGILGAFISLIISNSVILLSRLRVLVIFMRSVKKN